MAIQFGSVLSLNILSKYATVGLYHEFKMPGYLSLPFISVVMLLIIFEAIPISCEAHDASSTLIKKTIEASRGNGYMAKLMKSCHPLAAQVGNSFTVKRKMVMTLLELSISNIVLLFLSY